MTLPLKLCVSLLMVTVTAAAIASVMETLWGSAGWPKHRQLAAEVAQVAQENAALQAAIDTLQRQIAAQTERPEVQEALVRDLLGYVRPDDVIVRTDLPPQRP